MTSTTCANEVLHQPSCSPGKERDPESNNDYFGARYYASSMGRFMSPDWSSDPDPLPNADLSNPQTLNLYSYVNNNPLTYTDPDGHCWQGFQWACNVGQDIDNGFHGLGFNTDAQVEQNIHNAQQYLRNNTSIKPADLEKLSNKQVLDIANGAQSGKDSVISDSVKFILNCISAHSMGLARATSLQRCHEEAE